MGISQRTIDKTDLRNYFLVLGFALFGIFGYIILTGYIFGDFMTSIVRTELYPISATLTSVIFFGVLFFRAKQNNVRGIRYLLIFGFSIFMFNLLQIFRWDVAQVYTPFKRPLGNEILNLADMFIAIAILALYLHFESIENNKLQPFYTTLLALSVFPIIVVNLLVIITQNEEINSTIKYFLPWFSLSVIFITFYGIRVTLRIYLFTEQELIRKGTLSMMASIVYMAMAFSTQTLTSDFINFGFFEAEIHQLWLFALATSMLSYAYIVNPYFLYAFPFNISEIMVYDNDGVPLWDYQFTQNKSVKSLPIKSGALNAVGLILKELSGFSGALTNVQFTDGHLLITPMERFTLCLITEKNSRLIAWAFRGFSNEMGPLIETYLQETLRQTFSKEDENHAKKLITKYFPFTNVE